MPAELERRLKKQAQKKGIQNPDAYVYGTLRKTGWKPSHQISSSGEKTISKKALQRKLGNLGNSKSKASMKG